LTVAMSLTYAAPAYAGNKSPKAAKSQPKKSSMKKPGSSAKGKGPAKKVSFAEGTKGAPKGKAPIESQRVYPSAGSTSKTPPNSVGQTPGRSNAKTNTERKANNPRSKSGTNLERLRALKNQPSTSGVNNPKRQGVNLTETLKTPVASSSTQTRPIANVQEAVKQANRKSDGIFGYKKLFRKKDPKKDGTYKEPKP